MKPQNSVWFEDAELKNLIVCQPDNRNKYNKIFGGFIMRQAYELAWANTYVFGKSRPFGMHMDDILFKAPVEVAFLQLPDLLHRGQLHLHKGICWGHL